PLFPYTTLFRSEERELASGFAVVGDVLVTVSIWGGPGWRAEERLFEDTTLENWSSSTAAETAELIRELGPEAYDRELRAVEGFDPDAPLRRVDHLAERAVPMTDIASAGTGIIEERFGLPALALGMTIRNDFQDPAGSVRGGSFAMSYME